MITLLTSWNNPILAIWLLRLVCLYLGVVSPTSPRNKLEQQNPDISLFASGRVHFFMKEFKHLQIILGAIRGHKCEPPRLDLLLTHAYIKLSNKSSGVSYVFMLAAFEPSSVNKSGLCKWRENLWSMLWSEGMTDLSEGWWDKK